MKYCYAPDVVQKGPMLLPAVWADPVTGISYSNFNILSDPALLELGWYPYVENEPVKPGSSYDKTYSAFTILETTVERDVIWVEWSEEQKDTELEENKRWAKDAIHAEQELRIACVYQDPTVSMTTTCDSPDLLHADTNRALYVTAASNRAAKQQQDIALDQAEKDEAKLAEKLYEWENKTIDAANKGYINVDKCKDNTVPDCPFDVVVNWLDWLPST